MRKDSQPQRRPNGKGKGKGRASPAAEPRANLYDEVTAKIIAELEAGTFPWVRPWGRAGAGRPGLPRNAATGRRYSGINVLLLWGAGFSEGYASQNWLTFRQALAAGGSVRKGERGTTVVYADRFTPEAEKERARETGEDARVVPFLKRFTVFNLDQCEGLDRLAVNADLGPARDAALAAELVASAKDRAENLMIVDLMRNDVARAARPGSVKVERLFALESHPTVHHLVSTVSAQAAQGVGPAEVMEAAFPPGSITGAPKHQAMKVIAGHEPPRGPWCGSLFGWGLGEETRLTASVLIRTAAFERGADGWRWRALAGAGIVADSDPRAERLETEAKFRALKEALVG